MCRADRAILVHGSFIAGKAERLGEGGRIRWGRCLLLPRLLLFHLIGEYIGIVLISDQLQATSSLPPDRSPTCRPPRRSPAASTSSCTASVLACTPPPRSPDGRSRWEAIAMFRRHLVSPCVLVVVPLPLQQVVVCVRGCRWLRDSQDSVYWIRWVSATQRRVQVKEKQVTIDLCENSHLRPGWVSMLDVSGPGLGLSYPPISLTFSAALFLTILRNETVSGWKTTTLVQKAAKVSWAFYVGSQRAHKHSGGRARCHNPPTV